LEKLNFHKSLIERYPTSYSAGVDQQMAKFKIIVSDPEGGTSKIVELEEARAAPFIGRKIGESLDGAVVDLPAHKLRITGGSDRDGVPMRPNVHGGVRRKVVLSGGVGFKPEAKGGRRRKTVRGNVITDEIVQINTKIIEKPKKPAENKTEQATQKPKDTPSGKSEE
jgi:small subunit ribosomal protein S6e